MHATTTATVFLSGHFASTAILDPVLGTDGWKVERVPRSPKGRVETMQHPDYGTIIWSYHPQYCRRKGTEPDVTRYIGSYIARLANQRTV